MFRWINQIERLSRGYFVAASVAIVVLVGWVDYATNPELSFAVFYLLALGVATWFVGRGLRRSELAALKWSDLHLDALTPFVKVRASTTKNGKPADIRVLPEVAAALRESEKIRVNLTTMYSRIFLGLSGFIAI